MEGSVEWHVMLKRIRRLRISLAAKCQILFGAAVVMIIAAALAVPWQRITQLTRELNEGPADALADVGNALDRFVDNQEAGRSGVAMEGVDGR